MYEYLEYVVIRFYDYSCKNFVVVLNVIVVRGEGKGNFKIIEIEIYVIRGRIRICV